MPHWILADYDIETTSPNWEDRTIKRVQTWTLTTRTGLPAIDNNHRKVEVAIEFIMSTGNKYKEHKKSCNLFFGHDATFRDGPRRALGRMDSRVTIE
jgi:hypothetical protein